jgi:hypothetical protein
LPTLQGQFQVWSRHVSSSTSSGLSKTAGRLVGGKGPSNQMRGTGRGSGRRTGRGRPHYANPAPTDIARARSAVAPKAFSGATSSSRLRVPPPMLTRCALARRRVGIALAARLASMKCRWRHKPDNGQDVGPGPCGRAFFWPPSGVRPEINTARPRQGTGPDLLSSGVRPSI